MARVDMWEAGVGGNGESGAKKKKHKSLHNVTHFLSPHKIAPRAMSSREKHGSAWIKIFQLK